ncbi:MAG TPA: secretin N-terminal domain-containing protein [Candidatus Babeliales bacterium]|nr:secretin N-terminal domain-containing protein [Candidatus Babeliales bacterium]
MKIKFWIFVPYMLLLCMVLAVESQAMQEATTNNDKAEPLEMTPDQLEDSLRIDKHDLELDNQLNLSSEIDSLESTSEQAIQPDIEPPLFAKRSGPRPSLMQAATPEPVPVHMNTHRYPRARVRPPISDPDQIIEFQFEDADLQNLLTQISELFDVTFITDEAISPLPKGGKAIKGNKISFKTNKPLTKAQAWDLFVTFLDIADFVLVPEANPKFIRVMQTAAGKQSPIPSYLGVKPETLPDNDQLIRYLYFVENTSIDTIKTIVDALRSSASGLIILQGFNGFVLTDKAQNIKSLMAIITELDRVTMPQSMSVLKLRRADAQQVKQLYDSLTTGDQQSITDRMFPTRIQPTALYFPENTRIIAEPRTNSLILLGPIDSIKKIEEFVTKYVDVELGAETMTPLRVYRLKYADCKAVAAIMNDVVQFGKGSPAGQYGGVRDGDKYIKSLTFTAEPNTNSLIIKGEESDYLQARAILEKLDEPQPQIAVDCLILTIDLNDNKALGTQLRSKIPGIDGAVGNNFKYQTSGVNMGTTTGIITDQNPTATGSTRLLGDLINLVTGAGPGNTVVTLGSDQFGVWGIFNVLQTVANTEVISNPFLLATNKQKAQVAIGTTRRVQSGNVITGVGSTSSFADDAADLILRLTPQINSDGMIVLQLEVQLNNFVNATNFTDATKNTKIITTNAVVADKEVLALGGLIQNNIATSISKVPILGDIPLLGWFFKYKTKIESKSNLLILISSQIIEPNSDKAMKEITDYRLNEYHGTLDSMHEVGENRDPIHRAFFAPPSNGTEEVIDDYLFNRNPDIKSRKMTKKEKKKKHKEEAAQRLAKQHAKPISKSKPLIEKIEHMRPAASVAPVKQASIPAKNNTQQIAAAPKKKRSSLSDLLADGSQEANA